MNMDATQAGKSSNRPFLIFGSILGVVALIVGGLFLRSINNKAERGVKAAETVTEIATDAKKAVAPLGQGAVDKGVEALKNVDGAELGKSATEGIKEVGHEAKEASKELLRKAKERAARALDKDKSKDKDKPKEPDPKPAEGEMPPAEKPAPDAPK